MKELMFQNQTIRLVEKDGKQWASAADIARALGYSRADKVTRIYDRHKIEFTDSMTRIIETPTLGASANLVTQTRVFSLRGAHLIGMFSRTKKAQEFRRWILDVIEKHQAQPSLIEEWFKAKAELEAQEKFASLCGRGLSEHKYRKPPLKERVEIIYNQLQPSLQLI